jgi:hypothetical protein
MAERAVVTIDGDSAGMRKISIEMVTPTMLRAIGKLDGSTASSKEGIEGRSRAK